MNEIIHLDPAAIERLQRLGGRVFVVKMIDLFSSYGGEKLAAANRARREGNLIGIADAVHPIKSSAGNIGAKRVQALAQQIEQLARQSQGEALPGLLDELDAAFVAAKNELEQIKNSPVQRPGSSN
jgi:HPt (histidine-containing phosphotransfer) domain-containing protein